MYIGTSINNSATVELKAGAEVTEFQAVKFSSGKMVGATAGDHALGLVIPGQEGIKADSRVTVQVKEMGLWKTGGEVAAGAELTPDKDGLAVTATGGDFILAVALEPAAAKGTIIKVQIIKAGYKPAA